VGTFISQPGGLQPLAILQGVGGDRVPKLLVVEHHDVTRRSLKTYLSAALPDSSVQDAKSAFQAMEMIAADPPDVVIMDYALPQMCGTEMSGTAASREIKLCWPEVRVIMLAMDPSQRNPALQAGADACVLKGGASGELLDAVRILSPPGPADPVR
jgi:DNA-binding NarL/FixJ family response regulator